MKWKQVPLEVSDSGDVRFRGRLLPTRIATRLYQNVTLQVHKLVAVTFLGEPDDPKCVIDHKDGNPSNNRLSNLQWLTQRENTQKHFKTRPKLLPPADVRFILKHRPKSALNLIDLAQEFGVSVHTVRAVRTGLHFNGKGSSNRAILNGEQVKIIRAWKPHSPTSTELARQFSVSAATILNIWHGRY